MRNDGLLMATIALALVGFTALALVVASISPMSEAHSALMVIVPCLLYCAYLAVDCAWSATKKFCQRRALVGRRHGL